MNDNGQAKAMIMRTMADRAGILAAAALGLGFGAPASADDIRWVGFQGGCALTQTDNASWFDGMHWFGFVVPGSGDHAILQAQFDPQGHSVPQRYLHLGNFTSCPTGCPNPAFIPGGDATMHRLSVLDGIWTIDGNSGRSGAGCSLPQPMIGTLTATDGMSIGLDTRSAELTVLNTTLTTGPFNVGAGTAPSTGKLTISGPDTHMVKAFGLDSSIGDGSGNSGTLVVVNDATFSFQHGLFAVGRGGAHGSMHIQTGGSLATIGGNIWIGDGASSSASISGAGSHLSTDQSLVIPNAGNGAISITDGGEVSCGTALLGFWIGAQGSATVAGAGSSWDSAGHFRVGGGFSNQTGTGTLEIMNGGRVSADLMWVGDEGGTGTLEVRDPGSELRGLTAVGGGVGSYGEVTIANGASASSLNKADDPLFVFIGTGDDSYGVMTVTGSGSRWDGIDLLSVSGVWHTETDGEGHLVISDGGEVLCNEARIAGFWPANRGSVAVRGLGSRWDLSSSLQVGSAGEMMVEDGGAVSTGGTTFLTGVVDIVGNLSRFDVLGQVQMYDNSSWTVSSGASISIAGPLPNNGICLIGQSRGSDTSQLTISGVNTEFIQSGQMLVGSQGGGSLILSGGATVSSDMGTSPSGTSGIIGSAAATSEHPAATGVVSISNPGTVWNQNGGMNVGFNGNGSLLIEDAGTLHSARGYIARNPGSTGSVLIAGAGSAWQIDDEFFIGGSEAGVGGEATLTLEDDGGVSCSSLTIYPCGTYRAVLGPDSVGLITTQHAQLGGTLEIVPADGYTPVDGDEFLIMSYDTLSGEFDTVVENGFTLETGPTGLTARYVVCHADFNNDGAVDFFDITAFLTAFNSGDLAADFAEPYGELNFFDVAAFLQLFQMGCP